MFEVNLVPDVKRELLHKQHLRNVIIVICIFVAMGCVGVLLLLGSVVGGQGIALLAQDSEMNTKSNQILTFQNVNQVLTLQDQLNKISGINNNKRVLSRIFGVLDVILPVGEDTVSMAELSVNLEESTINFDGQANSTSNIDYRALETFKKTAELSYYDYGRYIGEDGKEIPAFCIDEQSEGGKIYGVYHKAMKGCGGTSSGKAVATDVVTDDTTTEDSEAGSGGAIVDTSQDVPILRDMTRDELEAAKASSKYYFDSKCITFEENGTDKAGATVYKTMNSCALLSEPVNVMESSNGRDSAGNLVLRFSASVVFDRQVFGFGNKHMRIIGPTRQNVTDSYTQIRDMFDGSEACKPEDTACLKGD
jgi:hypothetical protein